MRQLVVLCLLASLAACMPQANLAPQPRQVAFDASEFAPYASAGTAAIAGQAFLKTRGGDVKYGAGNRVVLMPATRYTAEWWQRSVTGGALLEHGDTRADAYRRESVTDGEGRFAFDSLPAGDYFVVSSVNWEVVASRWASSTQGGLVGQQIHVNPGQRVSVVLPYIRPASGL